MGCEQLPELLSDDIIQGTEGTILAYDFQPLQMLNNAHHQIEITHR